MRSILVILLLIYAAPARAGSFADDFSRSFNQSNSAARQQRLDERQQREMQEQEAALRKLQIQNQLDAQATKDLNAKIQALGDEERKMNRDILITLAAQTYLLVTLCEEDHAKNNDPRPCEWKRPR